MIVGGIEYRWVEGDELIILEPIIEAHGWTSLNGKTCRALCAFKGAELVGFHVFQLFTFVGPLWLDRSMRGSGVAEDLVDGMVGFMKSVEARGYLVIADNPHAARMCEANGMRRIESPVYLMQQDGTIGDHDETDLEC